MKQLNLLVLALSLFLCFKASGQSETVLEFSSGAEYLINSTVRIEGTQRAGKGVGTGFFFEFEEGLTGRIPTIVTNRHVVAGMDSLTFFFKLQLPSGYPDYSNTRFISLPVSKLLVINHPDRNVDLCLIPLLPIIEACKMRGFTPFYTTFRQSELVDTQLIDQSYMVMNIHMVGYPVGL